MVTRKPRHRWPPRSPRRLCRSHTRSASSGMRRRQLTHGSGDWLALPHVWRSQLPQPAIRLTNPPSYLHKRLFTNRTHHITEHVEKAESKRNTDLPPIVRHRFRASFVEKHWSTTAHSIGKSSKSRSERSSPATSAGSQARLLSRVKSLHSPEHYLPNEKS